MRHTLFIGLWLALASPAFAQVVESAPDTGRRRPAQRIPLTPGLERTAFADAGARTLLTRARAARLAQDSALHAYDANTYVRVSAGMGFVATGRERLLVRSEHAARVRWMRGSHLVVEPTGRRSVFTMGGAQMDMAAATPIPYFPGRESLWIPSANMGVVQAEVDEEEMLHPLAGGAEAYYRYATGDSMTVRLPDGRTIVLRELRISARRPEWRAFVGSFWFDAAQGHLVRAAYRSAAELDVWSLENDDGDGPPWLMKTLVTPMRASLSVVTVEYGLHEGRFWLPRRNVAEAHVRAGFARFPIRFEETFRYRSVNAREVDTVPASVVAVLAGDTPGYSSEGSLTISTGSRAAADTSSAAAEQRESAQLAMYLARADSLALEFETARAAEDTAKARRLSERVDRARERAAQITRRREGCAVDSTYVAGVAVRYGGAVRTAIVMPCDTTHFATSPDLPESIFDEGEELAGAAEREALLAVLDWSVQPVWAPQPPVVRTGTEFFRYNRIEGISAGGAVSAQLGAGYVAQAEARLGVADLVPNGELWLSRSNGRVERRLGLFHRLAVANDDWGAPLSFATSVGNVVTGRDEGFYYRSWGAELAGIRNAPGLMGAGLRWRLFAEHQRSAGVTPNTQVSLANLVFDRDFVQNVGAARMTALGAGAELTRSYGADPRRLHLDVRSRTEAAFTARSDALGNTGYGRTMAEGTVSRPAGPLAAALTAAAGASVGDLPPQRAFYLGGRQTVRGQFAYPLGEGRVGDAFWLARVEVGRGSLAMRPSLFYDAGWAGSRSALSQMGRPLSGAGVGLSLLDGLLRAELARGIWPEQRWRGDFSLQARF